MAKENLEERVARIETLVKEMSDNPGVVKELDKRLRELSHLTSEDLLRQFTI